METKIYTCPDILTFVDIIIYIYTVYHKLPQNKERAAAEGTDFYSVDHHVERFLH